MHRFHELVAGVRMKAGLRALRNELEAARGETEESLLVVLGRADNRDCLKSFNLHKFIDLKRTALTSGIIIW